MEIGVSSNETPAENDLLPPLPTVFSTAGLEPYVPTPGNPWDTAKVRHLFRRAAFAPKLAEVNAGYGSTPGALVDALLAPVPIPPHLSWAFNAPFQPPLTSEQSALYSTWLTEMREWWIRLMLTQPLSITERMVLFWHGHFATEYSDVQVPQRMYRMLDLFRRHATGNFKDLVRAVTVDPAMLIYLNGVQNRVGSPNENYARELLELFTIGIGHYTQVDIANAARALTGWTVPATSLDPVFVSSRHDSGIKTFMGRSGNFNGDAIIDIIFEQPETARFICRKLYRFFVYETPNETIVEQLATILRSNNWELRPVLEVLLKSAHFFDPIHQSADISSPVERSVGAIRQLDIPVPTSSPNVPRFIRQQAPNMGQNLLEPPNVAGWPGYRQWINTTTLLQRNAFTDAIVTGRTISGSNIGFKVDPIAFASSFPRPNDATALVNDITTHLIAMPTSSGRRAMLLETLLAGIELYDWNISDPQAGTRIEGLLKVVFRMAEYQLE